jgi:Transposase DDE domain
VDQTATKIDGSYTSIAITRFTARREQVSRIRSRKRLHCSLLEPCAGKLARTVLRGGGCGDTVPLPGDYPRCRRALRRRGIIPRIARRGIESRERLGRYRWVVERTLSWLNRFRRLKVRYERRADIYQAFLSLGCSLICWQALNR